MYSRIHLSFSFHAFSIVLVIGIAIASSNFPHIAWPKEVERGSLFNPVLNPVFSPVSYPAYHASNSVSNHAPLEPAQAEEGSRTGSFFQIGDFMKNSYSSVSLSTEEEYNDNVYLDANPDADPESSDFITRIKLGVKAGLASRHVNISLNYQPEQILFSRNADKNELKHEFTVSLDTGLDRSITLVRNLAYLEFSDTVSRENLYSRRQAQEESPLVKETSRNELRIYPYLKKRISRTNSLEFGYEYTNTGYSNSQATDRETCSSSLILRKAFSRRMDGNISYLLGREFTHGSAFQDYSRQEASLGLADQIGPSLKLTGTSGYTWLRYHNMDEDEGTFMNVGLIGAFPLIKVPGIFYQYASAYQDSVENGVLRIRRHSLGGSYDRRIKINWTAFTQRETYQETEWEDESWGTDGSFTVALNKRINLSLSGGWTHGNFKPENEKVKSWSADTSILWKIFPSVQLAIGYRHSRRNSNLDANADGYKNTIASVRADMEL